MTLLASSVAGFRGRKLYAERGCQAPTPQETAKAVEVRTGTLFRCVRSKADLRVTVMIEPLRLGTEWCS